MAPMQEELLQKAMQTPLFSGLDRHVVKTVIELLSGEVLNFCAGQTIYEDNGRQPDRMYLILKGMVQLVYYGMHGERYLIDYSFAGSVCGYVGSSSDRYLFNSSYIAGRDCTLLQLNLPEKALPGPVKTKLLSNLLRLVSDNYARLLQKGDITTKRFVRDRIITYLSYESQLRKSDSFDIPLNRQELADYLCVDRTTLSSELTRLKTEGLIRTRKYHFELLKESDRKEQKSK